MQLDSGRSMTNPNKNFDLLDDPSQKITELRNEKRIVASIKYAEEELGAHLQLGNIDSEGKILILQSVFQIIKNIGLGQTNKELSKNIDELLETLNDLDKAIRDLIDGAEAQAREIALELERILDNDVSQPRVSFLDVSEELKRRDEMREKIVHIQEELENQRDEIIRQIDILSGIINSGMSQKISVDKSNKFQFECRLSALVKTIDSIIESVAQNDREVEQLVCYQNAFKLIREGLPDGLIGKDLQFSKLS